MFQQPCPQLQAGTGFSEFSAKGCPTVPAADPPTQEAPLWRGQPSQPLLPPSARVVTPLLSQAVTTAPRVGAPGRASPGVTAPLIPQAGFTVWVPPCPSTVTVPSAAPVTGPPSAGECAPSAELEGGCLRAAPGPLCPEPCAGAQVVTALRTGSQRGWELRALCAKMQLGDLGQQPVSLSPFPYL